MAINGNQWQSMAINGTSAAASSAAAFWAAAFLAAASGTVPGVAVAREMKPPELAEDETRRAGSGATPVAEGAPETKTDN